MKGVRGDWWQCREVQERWRGEAALTFNHLIYADYSFYLEKKEYLEYSNIDYPMTIRCLSNDYQMTIHWIVSNDYHELLIYFS